MSIVHSNSYPSQAVRRDKKTTDQQLKQAVVNGTGLSAWESEVFVKVVDEMYFQSDTSTLKPGDILFCCVSVKEGAGKPLDECEMVTARLTLLGSDDFKELDNMTSGRLVAVRRRRMLRLCDQALDQGGVLSQEDLAVLLMSDVKTIRRDIAALKKTGTVVPTRGTVKDIGPGVTHRELVVRHWMEGKEELEICRATHHSMGAVENYLKAFKRVVFLRETKKFTDHEIAVTAGISARLVGIYTKLFTSLKGSEMAGHRLNEINVSGSQYYKETGQKKDSQPVNCLKNEGRSI